jgi:hypothetical protein
MSNKRPERRGGAPQIITKGKNTKKFGNEKGFYNYSIFSASTPRRFGLLNKCEFIFDNPIFDECIVLLQSRSDLKNKLANKWFEQKEHHG